MRHTTIFTAENRKRTGLALALVLAVGFATGASAASIEVHPPLPTTPNFSDITISGEITQGDFERFKGTAATVPPTDNVVVFLASDGGNLVEGLEIGEWIQEHGYATAVVDGSRCASSCALAWLAGSPRMMGPDARVGFHAAFDKDGSESGQANALVGAYLTRLKLGYAAVAYLTAAKPGDMRWLAPDDARRLGIAVDVVQPKRQASYAPTVQAPPTFGHVTFPLVRGGLQGMLFASAGRGTMTASMRGWITAANVVDFCNRTASQSSPAYDKCVKAQASAIGAEVVTTANCSTGLISYLLNGKVRASMSGSNSDIIVDGMDAAQSRTMLLDQFKLLCPAAAHSEAARD